MSAPPGSLFDDDAPSPRSGDGGAGPSQPPRSPATPASPVLRGPGGDSEARWAEAEANMAAFGGTVAAVARLLDGAVYLPAEEHATRAQAQQLSATVLAQNRRVKALEEELGAARGAQRALEARLRDATQLVATLRGEAADAKTALAAHVAELLDTKRQLEEAQAALRHGLEGFAGVTDI